MWLLLWTACAGTADTGGAAASKDSTPSDSPGPDSGGGPPPDSGADTSDSSGDSAEDSSADSAPDTGTSWVMPARPDTDHPSLTDSWRYGGGAGYPDTVDPSWPVVTRVSDVAGLQSALAAASAGDIVYVEDDAELDLTGLSLCIPGGVWLAGDRGLGKGALLYSTAGASSAVLVACGEDVRITGLRLRGPDPETCPSEWPDACPNDVSGDSNCAYCTDTAYGISTTYAGLEVDNDELSGWTYAAVGVQNAVGADVHHDHIHHDWREGLGYGVVIYGSSATEATIRWNRIQAVRHAVAGQGYPDESYEARDNLVEDQAIGHVFDMHGENEIAGDGSSAAGGTIDVHENTVLVADQYSLVVRGEPDVGAWLYDNCLAPPEADAYDQRYYYGHFTVDEAVDGSAAPNLYGQSPGDCGTLHWCLSDDGVGPVRYGSASGTGMDELLVGDLDGDGRDDVFGLSAGTWRWANPDGGSWASLASSGAALSSLALADLDGDGTDDVFYANGSAWYWSSHGTTSWSKLTDSTYTRTEVGFGDFDGDGAVDVFTTEDGQWRYRPGGSGAPVELAVSSEGIDELGFGDFDGDGITDVFHGNGSHWQYSRSGRASWADLASSSETMATLRLADVDGDGVSDVLDVSGQRLRVSYGGSHSWATLRYQTETLDELQIGDFDGDGRADVLTGGCL